MRVPFAATLMLSFTLTCQLAFGQLPESVEIKNANVTVVLRKFRWMTTQKLKPVVGGFGQPVDPKPLDPSKLYPPGTDAYLYFDYEKQIEPTDKPDGFAVVYVTLRDGQTSNRPFELKEPKGVGYIGLTFCGVDGLPKPSIRFDGGFEISVYGKLNSGSKSPSLLSKEKLKLKIAIDGVATNPQEKSEELKIIDSYIGTWNVETIYKQPMGNPKEYKQQKMSRSVPFPGGKFIEEWSGSFPGIVSRYTIFYDEEKKQFRSWAFCSIGSATERVGIWDATSKTITWRSVSNSPNIPDIIHRFIDANTYESSLIKKDSEGRVELEETSISVRVNSSDNGSPLPVKKASESLFRWTSIDGKTITARFVKIDRDSVVIEKDRKAYTIPFTKLTLDSVELAKSLALKENGWVVEE
jgi:hypothetical protein